MGGLVARSACHHGGEWTALLRHTVSLGTPHMGAPLEQAVHAMSAALHAVPETRPFARFLRRRSAGIRDLRRGSLVDEDWRDQDPDALRAKALAEVPLLEHATHYFVAATVTRSAEHPVGRLLGDTLVLAPSASGRSRGPRCRRVRVGRAAKPLRELQGQPDRHLPAHRASLAGPQPRGALRRHPPSANLNGVRPPLC
jgi:hypothetical protein